MRHSVTRVPAVVVRRLRTAVLRPTWTDRLATYPEDDAPATVHVSAVHGGAVVGVGTIYPETPPEAHRGAIPDAAYAPGAAWRLRGMATDEAVRGTGAGAAVLDGCFAAVRDGGGSFLWCNARSSAAGFYARMGLEPVGDEFDIRDIGPHFVMWRQV